MRIDRVWAMPNKWTFQIQPIAKLLREEVNGGVWADPYSGNKSPATMTNDLNPRHKADSHIDALEYLSTFETEQLDGVLFDPPYSNRQLKECYTEINYKPDPKVFNARYQALQRNQISRIIKSGGKAICFGWHSNGIGKTRGFKLERVLLVAHGRQHHDTIVTVERKMNGSLF